MAGFPFQAYSDKEGGKNPFRGAGEKKGEKDPILGKGRIESSRKATARVPQRIPPNFIAGHLVLGGRPS